MTSLNYKILRKSNDATYNIPLYLNSTLDELGGMVGFDGWIEQIEQITNFSYIQTNNTVTIYLTTNASKVNAIMEIEFLIDWGNDNYGVISTTNNTVSYTYPTDGEYKIKLTLDTPWKKQIIEKILQIPSDITVTNPLGTIENINIPYTDNQINLDYLNDLDYTNYDSDVTFTFMAMGKSRVSELKLYGSDTYSGITIETSGDTTYTGYTIDGLYYRDYPDGFTMITGNTADYEKEEVFNQMLTRNEHFIGFIDEPLIYSDIFVERGKQGVVEKTLRLSEVDNIGELSVYGNGYFTIIKQ